MHIGKRISTGTQAGLVAGGGVALFYLATDVVRLAPLETVAALARALLGLPAEALPPGLDIAALATTGAAVGVYSLLHFAAFAALGLLATFVVPAASFWATLGRGAVFGCSTASLLFIGARTAAGSPFAVEPISTASLLLVNAAAGVLMAAVLAVHTSEAGPE
jgi:hypothetical protein